MTTAIDSALLASVRSLANRKGSHICEILEAALRLLLVEDEAKRTDTTLAPLIDRVIETRLKAMEGGLRTMIARMAHENLTLQYIICNFIVEANIPPSKVERWRTDGYKFAVLEYRRRPKPEWDQPPEDE